ncbi:MAG TPA: hypothetical protein VFB80_24690 [Pirellulaceae bacterium]|nr:hypothetical protein [Pirellulaceae bacterium]
MNPRSPLLRPKDRGCGNQIRSFPARRMASEERSQCVTGHIVATAVGG